MRETNSKIGFQTEKHRKAQQKSKVLGSVAAFWSQHCTKGLPNAAQSGFKIFKQVMQQIDGQMYTHLYNFGIRFVSILDKTRSQNRGEIGSSCYITWKHSNQEQHHNT